MGWTGVYERVDKPIDFLKAELEYSKDGRSLRFLDAAMVGTVFYAAAEIVRDGARRVVGVVILTGRGRGQFLYKEMDETQGPAESKCPRRILEQLTALTGDEAYAEAWRARCWAQFKRPQMGAQAAATLI